MGLDNYPYPDPCKVLEKAGKLKIFKNERGDVDCTATNCPFTQAFSFPTLSCWIRGKIFDRYVIDSCGESLYENKTRNELEYILDSLKKYYKVNDHNYRENINQNEFMHINQLILYLETLLSIKEWDGELVAWF